MPPNATCAGQVVVVTGAGRGIGFQTAQASALFNTFASYAVETGSKVG